MNVKNKIAEAATTMTRARILLREAGQMALADELQVLIDQADRLLNN